MKNLIKPLLVATVLSLAIGNTAMAEPNHQSKRHCMQKSSHKHHAKNVERSHQPRFLKGIDLTEEQKDQIFAIKHAEVPKARERMKARHTLKQELMAMSDNFNEGSAKVIADKLAAIESEGILARAQNHQKILNLLTPAQKKQVSENRQKFKERHQFKQTHGSVNQDFHLSHSNPVAI